MTSTDEKSKDIEAQEETIVTAPVDSLNKEETLDSLKHPDEQRNVGTLDRKLKSRHVQFLALSGKFSLTFCPLHRGPYLTV